MAWAPSFLEEALLEHHEETLRGAISCSLGFSKSGLALLHVEGSVVVMSVHDFL